MGFLSPYRVLDFTDDKGLAAGNIFASLGADVVHIEPPAGSPARRRAPFLGAGQDGRSLYWEALTIGQRSVACDLTTAAGRDIALSLAARADFVFESAKPGEMAALGLSYDDFQRSSPQVIHVAITPFGEDGPKAHYAGSDIVLWAAGGPLASHRDGDFPPVRISVPQASLAAGADAASAALLAHFDRTKTGLGQHVTISSQASVTQATICRILAASVGDTASVSWDMPPSAPLDASEAPDGAEAAASGKWQVSDGLVELHLTAGPSGARTNRLWQWLTDLGADGGLPAVDWREVPRLVEDGILTQVQVDRYSAQIRKVLRGMSKAEVATAAAERSFLAAPINTIADLAENDHLRFHEFWTTVGAGTERELTVPGPYARVSVPAFAAGLRPGPEVGEHTGEVLREWLGTGQRADEQREKSGAN